ncbi:MAG: PAS domain S-box protein [Bacteroidales bacterium]
MSVFFYPTKKYYLIFVFLLTVILGITAGYLYNKFESEKTLKDWKNNLETSVHLKSGQISSWYLDELYDVKIIAENEYLNSQINTWLKSHRKKDSTSLVERLSSVEDEHNLKRVILISPDGKFLLSTDSVRKFIGDCQTETIKNVLEAKNELSTGFFRCYESGDILIAFLAPVYDGQNKLAAVLTFQYDPDDFLYPLVNTWPTSEESAETYLIRRNNDSVTYLNELKHLNNLPLKYSVSIDDTSIAAVQAASGYEGFLETQDYVGNKVLAYSTPVESTPWFLVSKINKKEVLSEINRESWFVALFVLILLLLVASGLSFFYTSRQRNIYRKLHENTERLNRALENIPDVVVIYDNNFKIIYVNKALEKLSGSSRKDFLGMHEKQLWGLKNHNITIDLLNKTLSTGKIQSCEIDVTFPRHGTRNLHVTYIPLFGKNNNVKEIMAIVHDLTEFFQHQQEYKELINNMHESVFVVDQNGKFKEINDSAVDLLGYSRDELLSMGPGDIDVSFGYGDILEFIRSQNHQIFETRHKTKNGKVISVEISNSPITYRGEKAVIAIVRDITERKQSEYNLRLLSRAIEQSPVSVLIADAGGHIEYVNPKYTEVTGYKLEDILGYNPRILKSDYHSKEFYENLWKTILAGQDWHGEFRNKKKNGELFWESAIISPIVDKKGTISHFVEVKEDITEKKEMIEDLRQAKEKAEESDKLKTVFLQNISHEIRTPMNGIMGFTDLLKSPGISEDKKNEFIKMIQKSSNRMLNLINDLVDISVIESGEIEMYNEHVSINDILKSHFERYKIETERKDLKFWYETGLEKNRAVIETDETKFQKILSNLLDNALKFTNSGEVTFGYTIEGELLQFYVKDTGIGIPEDIKAVIFERFRQADSTITRPYEGTGLGLSISKAYAEMLGGDIWVDSEPGKGSVFYFTIPYKAPEGFEHLARVKNSSVSGQSQVKTILLVEDNEASREFIQTVLEEHDNINLLHAEDGNQAVEMVKNNPEIDIVLMDIKLPKMNGYEATRRIKKERPGLPVIAQTAYAMESDKYKALEAGCDDYITKPIDQDQLIKMIFYERI